jgi:hypothetical protein
MSFRKIGTEKMGQILEAWQIQHISNLGKGDTGNSSYTTMVKTSSCSPPSSTPRKGKGPTWEADSLGTLHPGNAPMMILSSLQLLGIFSCNI